MKKAIYYFLRLSAAWIAAVKLTWMYLQRVAKSNKVAFTSILKTISMMVCARLLSMIRRISQWLQQKQNHTFSKE